MFILTIDNDLEEKFIEYTSSTARTDHNIQIIISLGMLFLMIIFNLYRELKNPTHIDQNSVPEILRHAFRLVVRKYIVIFTIIFRIVHMDKFHKLALWLLQYTKSSIDFDLSLLEVLIPLGWVFTIITLLWYRYKKYIDHKKIHNKNINL